MPPILKLAGLNTANNTLSEVPSGALKVADNLVCRFKSVIEPRRGQSVVGGTTIGTSGTPSTSFIYRDTLFTQTANATISALISGTWQAYAGSFATPTNSLGIQVRGLEAQQDLYFTSNTGVQWADALPPSGTVRYAGVKRAVDMPIVGPSSGGATGAWMATNSKVGYRVAWYTKDQSGRLVLGAPSGRLLFSNPGGGQSVFVKLYVPVPFGVSSKYYLRLYRTPQSASATTDPGDNYYLAEEIKGADTVTASANNVEQLGGGVVQVTNTAHTFHLNDTAFVTFSSNPAGFDNTSALPFKVTSVISSTSFQYTQISAGSNGVFNTNPVTFTPAQIFVTDYCPDTMLGTPLYTNPMDGDGSSVGASDNAEPPFCLDMALWQNRNWYANTKSKQRYQIQLIGVNNSGSNVNPAGLNDGDTVTVAGRTYTGKSTPTLPTHFKITSNTTASLNVEATAMSLVNTINQDLTNGVYNTSPGIIASYISGLVGAPGLIQLEEVGVGGSAFTVSTSNPTAFAPDLSATPSSTNDAAPNRLFYSKPYQLEAVPLTNYLECGSKLKNILRVFPLRDKLYVFKEDGIYIISGTGPFRVDLLDETTRLVAPESAAKFNNSIYALTNQGVVSVSELGVRILSQPIEDQLVPFLASTFATTLPATAWGCGYESEHSYLLGMPTSSSDQNATQVYVYNTISQAWTRWPISRTFARVLPKTDTLYLGAGWNSLIPNAVYTERKSYVPSQDNADDDIAISIIWSASGGNVEINHGGTVASLGVSVGDRLKDDLGTSSKIIAIDSPSNGFVKVLDTNLTWDVGGTATVSKGYKCEFQLQAQISGDPGMLKKISEGQLHFKRLNVRQAQAESYTNINTSIVPSNLTPPQSGLFPRNERFLMPKGNQVAAYVMVGFTTTEAFGDWACQGISLEAEPVSERTTVK